MDGLSEPEPDYQKAYTDWHGSRTPQTTGKLLKTLQPVITRGISNYGGGKNDPLMQSRARRLTLNALQSYDPQHGTKLTTHLNNHLQGLRRVSRQQQQVLKVPERVSMEQAFLHNAQLELEDQLGREPSTMELADYAKISPRKISRLRRYSPGMAEGSLDEGQGDVQFGQNQRHGSDEHSDRVAMALHGDLEPRDQQILEWPLGLFGSQRISNGEIAQRLRLSPGAISQRKALIQQKYDYLLQGL